MIKICLKIGKNRDQEEAHRRTMQVLTISDDTGEAVEDEATLNERRLLSKYGVWLLAGSTKMFAKRNI